MATRTTLDRSVAEMVLVHPALELDGIGKLYGRTAALRAVGLRLEAGQTMALLGPNGSGKTTLLKIVAGAIAPTLGHGAVFGHDLQRDRLSLRSIVGLMASDSYLYEDLSAVENLRFLATMAGFRPDMTLIETTLQTVELTESMDRRVHTFSSGMKRRLSLARLLLLRPRLLLLDEPYNSLDAAGANLVDTVVRGQVASGGAVVLATHDAERALGLADQVVLLKNGATRFAGAAGEWRAVDAQHLG